MERLGLYPQLRAELWRGIDSTSNFSLDFESDVTRAFVRLMQAISAAKTSGDESDLPNLEHIMRYSPGEIHYTHEITQQAAAEAWAAIVVRTGLIKEYMKPQTDGGESKIVAMLADTNPLINKAALEAIRLGLGGK